MESGRASHCVFDRLMSLDGESMRLEQAIAILRQAGACSSHLACTRRLGCSWLALIVASRLSESMVEAATRDQAMAWSA